MIADSPARAPSRPWLELRLARWIGMAALLILAGAATVLLWRRLAGALVVAPGAAVIIFTGALLAILARIAHGGVGHAFLPAMGDHLPRRQDCLPHVVIAMVLVAAAGALSLPGSSASAIVLLWLMVIGSETHVAIQLWRAPPFFDRLLPKPRPAPS